MPAEEAVSGAGFWKMGGFLASGRVQWRIFIQPRPQGLPRGGARAEEDPGKIR